MQHVRRQVDAKGAFPKHSWMKGLARLYRNARGKQYNKYSERFGCQVTLDTRGRTK